MLEKDTAKPAFPPIPLLELLLLSLLTPKLVVCGGTGPKPRWLACKTHRRNSDAHTYKQYDSKAYKRGYYSRMNTTP